MAQITVEFQRRMVTYETVTRVVEGPSVTAARETADEMASEFNRSCPDDVETGSTNFEGWEVSSYTMSA